MKKTQFIDLITTIRKTAVSFIAIAVFIALGLAFYGGSSWSVKHTEESFVKTYQDGNMRTLLVSAPLGLTQAQVEELKTIDGIDDAEGCNIVYRFFENKSGNRQQAAVIQLTERIDTLLNVEGQLPTAAGQAAVLRSWAEENDVAIGDVIELQASDAVDYRALRCVRNVAEWDGTDISSLDVSGEDPGYLTCTTLTVTAIVDSTVYLSTNPYCHGICYTNGLYINAAFFVSPQEMPTEAFGGYTSVLLFSEELHNMSSFSDQYKARSQALSAEVQETLDKWDSELIEAFSASVDVLGALPDTAYSDDAAQVYTQLSLMAQELSAQESFSSVLEVDSNNSFLTAENLIGVLDSVRLVMGITFLAIGTLICYSVIARLVADGAVQIGTRKALGFYNREILRLYLCYVGTALLLGGLLGTFIGVYGVELGFKKVLAAQFTFTPLPLVCDISEILPVFFIVCGIIFIVTITACRAETAKNAITLLQDAHKNNVNYALAQKSKLLHRLSMLNQTVLLNLMRDKRRVFGMITGVVGAAALITAGLSFYVNFTNAFSKQFQDYYCFDYEICFNADSDTAATEIKKVLDGYNLDYAEVYTSYCIMHTPDGKTNAPNVIVPADAHTLAQIMHFDIGTEKSAAYSQGVWMSEYYCYAFDAPVGSTLQLTTLAGREAELTIDCFYKHHLSTPAVVMDGATYSAAFGEEAAPNAFFVASAGLDMSTLSAALEEIDGYIYMFNFRESFRASFSSEKTVLFAFAAVFIIMAVLMALMTLINLLNVYISEKKDELIILMINGYDRKFAKKYIYQDTIVLTLIGIIIGLLAGSVMGEWALRAIEGSSLRMIHGVSFLSCAVAAAATAVLTAIICERSLRSIDKFRLSDIGWGK